MNKKIFFIFSLFLFFSCSKTWEIEWVKIDMTDGVKVETSQGSMEWKENEVKMTSWEDSVWFWEKWIEISSSWQENVSVNEKGVTVWDMEISSDWVKNDFLEKSIQDELQKVFQMDNESIENENTQSDGINSNTQWNNAKIENSSMQMWEGFMQQ